MREKTQLDAALAARYSDAPQSEAKLSGLNSLTRMAQRGSCRAFQPRPVPEDLLQVLSAVALASPTKSDLQQRDIIALHDPAQRAALAALVSGQGWVADAPMILVFCGNNRRQRQIHDWQGLPFANDHLDAVLNATADAAIALGAFVTAAEAAGLGCCPISAVRNRPAEVSTLLALPDHVFPFAGLAVGYPGGAPEISKRLPLQVTVHRDRYAQTDLKRSVAAYDADRQAAQPYATQRFIQDYGHSDTYGWSQDKARQYSKPERADFGAYLRAIGFRLD